MTVPYMPGGAAASEHHPAFAPRSLSSAGIPGGGEFTPRSQVPDRPSHVPRTLGSAEAPDRPPAFAGPDFSPAPAPGAAGAPSLPGYGGSFSAPAFDGFSSAPGYAGSSSAPGFGGPGFAPASGPGFVAPQLSHAAAQPGQYGLPSIAPNLFGGAPSRTERMPEPKPKAKRLFRLALWTAVIGVVLTGLSVFGVRLFLVASGMTVVPDLTAAEAGNRCQGALVNEVNRGLQAALIADRRIKSNVLTGVDVGEPKAVAGGFDVAGTGRYTVATGKKKAKPGKVQLTCQVRRDGSGQIVTTVATKAAKR